ncbi:uncharacterized protein M6D78_006705 isoform 1-T3 [Vipera latastei]
MWTQFLVSRHPENIKMHVGHKEPAGHDLSFKMRSHQILQTKTQRLEVDLKRAREQSFIKTMEISKLLMEKEELELKNQELINKNLQLTKEKEELCAEYEEKLRKKSSSDESVQLENLRQEYQSVNRKCLKYSEERKDLLREINDLNDELYREKQLRKGCCMSSMDNPLMVSPNSSENKSGSVSACQTSAVIREDDSEALQKMKPQMVPFVQCNCDYLDHGLHYLYEELLVSDRLHL